jgi:hypothetical protein
VPPLKNRPSFPEAFAVTVAAKPIKSIPRRPPTP